MHAYTRLPQQKAWKIKRIRMNIHNVYIYVCVCVLSFWEPSVRLGLSTDFRRTFSKPLKAFRFSSKPWHSMGHHSDSRGIVEGAPNNMQSKEKDRSDKEAGVSVRRRLPDSSCATLLFWNTHSQNLTESVQWKISKKKVQRSLSRQVLGFSPHLCVGFLFLILYPGLLLRLLLLRPPPHFVHTHFINKHFVQNTLFTHTLSTHTLSPHTLSTHALSTYTLCPHTLCHHTLCPQTLCPQTLCPHTLYQHTLCHHNTHTQHTRTHTHTNRHNTQQHTHTHNTHTHTPTDTTHNNTHTHNTHNTHNNTHTRAKDTWWHSHTHTTTHTHTQHTHTHTTTHTHKNTLGDIRGRRGTWWHPPLFHVAGVAQNSHPPSFCVAGVALMVLCGALGALTHIYRRFAWQAWHSWHWMARLDWLGRLWRRGTLRGRRGTTWHPPSFHVAGVAQTHIYLRFTWQAWHSWHWVARLDWLGRLWRRGTLRGRRGTTWHPPSFHVAGVAQTHIYLRFTWQAWHSWHWVARLDWLGRLWRRGTLRGRRGTNSHPPSFHVAGVAQTHIYLRFTWQAWHSWHWVARLDWLGRLWRRGTLRGRRGTNSHPPSFSRGRRGTNSHLPSFHVAGVALMALGGALGLAWAPVTPRHFAWQAWHNLTSTFVSRGRRGTNSHLPSFHVAGVALMALGGALGLAWAPVTPRHFAWQAWHKLTSTVGLRGRRGTNSHLPSFHVAGVALMALGGALGLAWAPVTPRHFAWQAWHKLTSTVGLRGRRGTNSHLPSFCVAGVALMALGGALGLAWAPVTPRHFAWQAWHKLTSTVGLRGRRGTNSHPPSFCVAGVGQMALGGALGLA